MITVVVPIHNRGDGRLHNLLTSLDSNIFKPDIVVVDTSDREDDRIAIKAQCLASSANLISMPRREFNKAKSLNIGINASITSYTALVDADMYFHPNHFAKALSILERDVFVLSLCGYLPGSHPGLWMCEWKDLEKLAREDEVSERRSPGACQIFPTDFLKEVGGYDERFRGMDGVDDDMIVRARKYGLNEKWIKDPIALHQWHPVSELKGLDSDKFTPEAEVVIERDWLSW